MRFPFFRNRDSVKNGILISIRRTGDGFHPGLFTAAGIKEKCCLDLFASCTAHDPHKGFAAWKFPFFLIALDPGLIHMEQPAFQQFLMNPPVDRFQPFLTASYHPVTIKLKK